MKHDKLLFTVLLVAAFHGTGSAQTAVDATRKLKNLTLSYENGAIGKKGYMDSVFLWHASNNRDYLPFKTDTLINLLSMFKKIAWGSDTSYSKYKIDYYGHLAENAWLLANYGESIYYYEKYDNQRSIGGRPPLYAALITRFRFFRGLMNYPKSIELYEKNLGFISSLPKRVANNSISSYVAGNSYIYFGSAAQAYSHIGDTVKVLQVVALAGALKKEYLKRFKTDTLYLPIFLYNIQNLDFYKAFFLLKDMPKSGWVLGQQRAMLYGNGPFSKKIKAFCEIDFLTNMIGYQLQINNLDSAAFYIKKYKSLERDGERDYDVIPDFQARLYAAKGRYDSSCYFLKRLISYKDSTYIPLTSELDKLLSAFMQAEDSRDGLQRAENEKEQQRMLIFIIVIISAVVISSVYLIMRTRTIKAKRKVEQLNNATQLQIAELEGINRVVQQEEQKRMAMDLHDNFAGYLVSLGFQIESESARLGDGADLRPWLQKIKGTVDSLYMIARNRSHELYELSSEGYDESFSNRIKTMLESSLPSSRYSLMLAIDDQSLAKVPLSIKISMLSILQEAITNIMKHAKASLIRLDMFVEDERLIMQVADNGKGMDTAVVSQNKGVGLRSIEARMEKVNGSVEFKSGGKGTEILVVVPLDTENLERIKKMDGLPGKPQDLNSKNF